jgi:hypothetical protein
MDINNKQPTAGQPTLPTRQLWRALLLIFNHYFLEELGTFRFRPKGERVPARVVDAIRLLDCFLDKAIQEGWLEEE